MVAATASTMEPSLEQQPPQPPQTVEERLEALLGPAQARALASVVR